MNAACFPSGQPVPGQQPQNVAPDLYTAMAALSEVLAELELDYENTAHAVDMCAQRRQRIGLERLAARYEQQLNLLRPFFDWNVLHDLAAEAA